MGDQAPRHSPRNGGEDRLDEIVKRARRIETRLTQLLVAQGIETSTQKPAFAGGGISGDARLVLPSPHTSMREVLEAIPDEYPGPVQIILGDQVLGVVRKSSSTT